MEPYERRASDEYCEELLRLLGEQKGRGHTIRWHTQDWKDSEAGVPPVYPSLGTFYKRGHTEIVWFAGNKLEALHRTRTGDPFLTMEVLYQLS